MLNYFAFLFSLVLLGKRSKPDTYVSLVLESAVALSMVHRIDRDISDANTKVYRMVLPFLRFFFLKVEKV